MKPRVVLVDDEPLLLRTWQRIFGRLDCDVTCFESGIEALEWLDSHRVDLLLTDLRMPRYSGYDLLRDLAARGIPESLTIIVCSGFVPEAGHLSDLPIERVIAKPFSVTAELEYFRDHFRRSLHES